MAIDKAKLIEGKVSTTILKLSVPMLIGMIGVLSFNLIDTYFISRLGTLELAAISFTFPITYIFTAIAMGLGNGASALVSRAIGEGNKYKVIRLASDGMMLSLIVVVVLLIIGFLTMEPLFRMLGANDETYPLIKQYMQIWYPGAAFLVLPMVGNMLTRATGDMKTPSMVMMLAVIVNAILDPLLIFGWGPFPRLEMAGAAIATFIAHFITFIFAIWILYFRDKMLDFRYPKFDEVLKSWKGIGYLGFPAAVTNLIVPIAVTVLISLIASYGQEAVAAFGVAGRVEALSLTIIMALGSVLGPFIGQNLGAKKFDRVNEAVKFTTAFSLVWGLVVAAIFALFSTNIAMIFNDEVKVIEIVNLYLWIVPISYGSMSILMLSAVSFNVLHKPYNSTALSLFRMVVLYVPLAYLGSYLYGIKGIFFAGLIANFVAGYWGWRWLKNFLEKRMESDPKNKSEIEIEPLDNLAKPLET